MLGRVTRRRVLAGLNLTRRTAHSGLLESASRRLPTRTYPLQFQALSPNGHTIVEPCLNATSIPPSSFPAGYCPKGPPPPLPSGSLAYVFVRKASRTLSFFPLKDSYGTTQLVVYRDPANVDKFAALSAVPSESVVLIQGRVRSRPVHSKRTVRFPFVIPFGSVL